MTKIRKCWQLFFGVSEFTVKRKVHKKHLGTIFLIRKYYSKKLFRLHKKVIINIERVWNVSCIKGKLFKITSLKISKVINVIKINLDLVI